MKMHRKDLKYPIKSEIRFGAVDIVLLDVPVNESFAENVFGFDLDGKLIWHISAVPRVPSDSPFVSIRIEGELLHAGNRDGTELWLDPIDGAIKRKEWYR